MKVEGIINSPKFNLNENTSVWEWGKVGRILIYLVLEGTTLTMWVKRIGSQGMTRVVLRLE